MRKILKVHLFILQLHKNKLVLLQANNYME